MEAQGIAPLANIDHLITRYFIVQLNSLPIPFILSGAGLEAAQTGKRVTLPRPDHPDAKGQPISPQRSFAATIRRVHCCLSAADGGNDVS
jgi:hypothetical protein